MSACLSKLQYCFLIISVYLPKKKVNYFYYLFILVLFYFICLFFGRQRTSEIRDYKIGKYVHMYKKKLYNDNNIYRLSMGGEGIELNVY